VPDTLKVIHGGSLADVSAWMLTRAAFALNLASALEMMDEGAAVPIAIREESVWVASGVGGGWVDSTTATDPRLSQLQVGSRSCWRVV
jgi:hypothetical protein